MIDISRKNIFEIAAETFDISLEIKRMYELFEKRSIAYIYGDSRYVTVREYASTKGFKNWKNRGRFLDADEYLNFFDIRSLWVSAKSDVHDLFLLIEIVYNFWHIANKGSYQFDSQRKELRLFKKVMDDCLAHYNYKAKYYPETERLIVVEDKPEATAVAEIIEQDLAYKVLQYNHYLLKGDLQAKKDILLALGQDLEPERERIKQINKPLEEGIFYLLNNLHLRHNNKDSSSKNYRPFVEEMGDKTMEYWYDELYQMILLAHLQLDQEERNREIKQLKRDMGQA